LTEFICDHAAECGMLRALIGKGPCVHGKPHAPGDICTVICRADYHHYEGDCVPVEKEEHLDM